ncbi:hypothetical protein [Enterococcus faecalis]|uniref:hypothetical protein n=1 Tax=Enterococcus faecalis TaxID=1351 RepID=UPI0029846BD5|nr:hypothetical protein [Enterococcus faecalis]
MSISRNALSLLQTENGKKAVIMKKIIVSTALLGGLMGTVLFIQAPVHAADTNKTDANITVNGGGLNIDDLGKIDFQAITLNGQEQTATPKDPADPTLGIHDYRGGKTGWTLQASLASRSNFAPGMALTVDPSTTDQSGTATKATLNESAATIYKLDAADLSKLDTKLKLTPTITVPANTPAKNYTATINWNAVDGAPA